MKNFLASDVPWMVLLSTLAVLFLLTSAYVPA
jgi:hypothetical protein